MSEIDEIKALLEVCDTLLGSDGCPWDREQTLDSVRKYLFEETCELLEAIDSNDASHIEEELGDVFYNAVYLARLAEKEQVTTLKSVVQGIKEKLVRRHPHVFGEESVETSDEVLKVWEEVKSQEKESAKRESVLDGIPKTLPALSRGYKVAKRMRKSCETSPSNHSDLRGLFHNEDALGEHLWNLCIEAEAMGLDPEVALRKILARKEKHFRSSEKC